MKITAAIVIAALLGAAATGLWILRAHPWFGPLGDPYPVVSGWLPHAEPGAWLGTTRLAHLVAGTVAIAATVAYAIVRRRRWEAWTTLVITAIVVAILSGLAVWKPVQLGAIATVFGGFDTARLVHFLATIALGALAVLVIVRTVRR